MDVYENTYFQFRVKLPPGWSARCRSKPGVVSGSRYQVADHDLPVIDGDYKTLLFALRRLDGSPSILGSRFCIVAHWRSNGYDLLDEIKRKSDIISLKSSVVKVLDREAQMVEVIQEGSDFEMTTKIVSWEEKPQIWISIYCDGDSVQSFQHAEEILASLSRI